MYKVILFDLDGTLTESGEGITKSVQYALERIGKPEPDLEKLKVFIGPPLMEMFMQYADVYKRQTAILARTMNIPALINIEYDDSMDGKMAVVDGKTGSLIVEPDAAVSYTHLDVYKRQCLWRKLTASVT